MQFAGGRRVKPAQVVGERNCKPVKLRRRQPEKRPNVERHGSERCLSERRILSVGYVVSKLTQAGQEPIDDETSEEGFLTHRQSISWKAGLVKHGDISPARSQCKRLLKGRAGLS